MHRTQSRAQRSMSELLQGLEVIHTKGSINVPVRGISDHSDAVKPGYLFVSIPGSSQDGHRFIKTAMERGALGSVVEHLQDHLPDGFTQIQVAHAREALAVLAANFYGRPAGEMTLVGITGTNGKTTTASLLEGILKAAGHRVGVLSTIEYRYGGRKFPAATTTPGSLELQGRLREMVDAKVTHAVMEVTSHALDQHRVHGCAFQGAVFTNLTRDHLDYHRDMDAYLDAKIRLFEDYLRTPSEDGWAVINAGTPASRKVESRCKGRIIRFGYDPSATFRALKWDLDLEGIRLVFRYPDGEMKVFSPLLGQPNLLNVLAACACAWALGVEPSHWAVGLRSVSSIPGRFEPVPNDRDVTVIVDYAHTPDALEQVLASARHLTSGRLLCVFGCGGDRDQGKRPLMAQAAARSSDLVVITSDNPRTEPPGAIIDQVAMGLRHMDVQRIAFSKGKSAVRFPAYDVIEDREEAIRKTIMWAKPGDMVVIAGKGHESVQIVGSKRIPFDDREVARRALREAAS